MEFPQLLSRSGIPKHSQAGEPLVERPGSETPHTPCMNYILGSPSMSLGAGRLQHVMIQGQKSWKSIASTESEASFSWTKSGNYPGTEQCSGNTIHQSPRKGFTLLVCPPKIQWPPRVHGKTSLRNLLPELSSVLWQTPVPTPPLHIAREISPDVSTWEGSFKFIREEESTGQRLVRQQRE